MEYVAENDLLAIGVKSLWLIVFMIVVPAVFATVVTRLSK